jgi:hypothetical protein
LAVAEEPETASAQAGGPQVDPLLEQLQGLADQLVAAGPLREGAAGAERLARLTTLLNTVELARAAQVAAYDASKEWEQAGYHSAVHYLRSACNLTGAAAVAARSVGRQASRLRQSAAAMRQGEIGFAHLALMASTAETLAEAQPAVAFDERPLLRLARQHLVNRFRSDCAHVRHAASERAFLQRQLAEHAYRELRFAPLEEGGLYLSGWFDPLGGAAIRTAVEALARKRGAHDQRLRAQRYADALVELAGHGLDQGSLPSSAGQRPHLQVTATVETLHNVAGAPAGEVEWGGPIAATTVQRLACDATVSRVLLDSASQVIDVGRKTRVISAPMRTALRVRDGGCVWPGCDRPSSWCQGHHLEHWTAHRGRTELSNLGQLCGRHHWMVHEGGYQLVRTDAGFVVIPPLQDYVSPPDDVRRQE